MFLAKITKKLLVLICALIFSNPSWALFEARIGYGALVSNPDTATLTQSPPPAALPATSANSGIVADFFVSPPMFDLGIGFRYGKLSSSFGTSALKFDTKITETSLLLNYRIINTLIYTGPVFTYGFSNTGSMQSIASGVTVTDFTPGSISNYSFGWEVGLKLLTFRVGAEAGYKMLKWKDTKDSKGLLTNKNVDLSGAYLLLLFGIGI